LTRKFEYFESSYTNSYSLPNPAPVITLTVMASDARTYGPTPKQWWKEDVQGNGINIVKLEPHSERSTARVRDFVEKTPQEVELHGLENPLHWLSNYILRGYDEQATASGDLECALFALEISLAPIYSQYGMTAPNFARLRDILGASTYQEKALTRLYEWCGPAPPEDMGDDLDPYMIDWMEKLGMEESEAKNIWANYFSKSNLSVYAMLVILDVLREEDGLNIALGIITYKYSQDCGKYSRLGAYDARVEFSSDENIHGIAWATNDNAELWGGIGHWSGVAPSTTGSPVPEHSLRVAVEDGTDDIADDKAPDAVPDAVPGTVRPPDGTLDDMETPMPGSFPADAESFSMKRYYSQIDLSPPECGQTKRRKDMPIRPTFPKRNPHRQAPSSPDVMDLDFEEPQQAYRFVQDPQNTLPQEPELPSPLFQDLRGNVPEGHFPLQPYEKFDTPLSSEGLSWERSLAEQQAKKRICNAPHWDRDLPWDQMGDITREELIMYFPNHVLHWPILALWVVKGYWDDLFQRMSALINRVRGSQCSHRNKRHAEPFPCMLKVEEAINELQYTLTNLTHIYALDSDVVLQYVRTPPKALAGRVLEPVSIEEAAAYVLWPEFLDKPFSKLLLQMGLLKKYPHSDSFYEKELAMRNVDGFMKPLPLYLQKDYIPFARDPEGRRFSNPDMSDVHQPVDNSAQEGMPRKSYSAPGGQQQYSRACMLGGDCPNRKCEFEHPAGWNPILNRGKAPVPVFAPNPDKPNSQNPKSDNPKKDTAKKTNKICWNGGNCENPKCQFEHPVGWDAAKNKGKSGMPAKPVFAGDKPCRNGAKCNNKETCPFNHDEKQPQAGGKGSSELKLQRTPCKHDTKCRNAECTFAHSGPAVPKKFQVKFDKVCKHANRCTQKQCHGIHPSPACKVGTGGPRNGNGNGKGGKRRNPNEGTGNDAGDGKTDSPANKPSEAKKLPDIPPDEDL
jgi:hypothetical protein